MIIVLIRHGKAEPPEGKRDEERELTEHGKEQIKMLSKLLPVKPKRIFTSPLVRAVQTAEIISSLLGGEIIKEDRLRAENFSIDALKALRPEDCDFFVCHAPSVEKVVSSLIGGGNVKMRSGSAAGIELEDVSEGSGILRFLIPPEIVLKE